VSAPWPLWVALRYLHSGRKERSVASSIFPVVGIGIGVMTLIVVLAVMNGFQLGFIESILDISSYHLRVEAPPSQSIDEGLVRDLKAVKGVSAVLPFVELQTIARGDSVTQHGCLVRGVGGDAAVEDPSLVRRMDFVDGSFDLRQGDSIILGAELATYLGVVVGDTVSILSLTGGAMDSLSPQDSRFYVTGIFRSGFYEYDLSWAFIRSDTAIRLHGGLVPVVYGVKLQDRWADQRAIAEIRPLIKARGAEVLSWRDYNRSFFGALRTEKTMMILLVALIFVVVGLSVFQGQRRIVLGRQDEIGLLKAIGASALLVRSVFAIDGFLIGLSGACLGLIPGLAIAGNISGFFSLLETMVNGILHVLRAVESILVQGNVGGGSFSIFSPAVFYIKGIPSRVIPSEVLMIFSFGVLSATLASWFASSRISKVRPAEVLRYE